MNIDALSEQVYSQFYGATLRTWANGGGEWTFPDGTTKHRTPFGGPAKNIENAMEVLCKARGKDHFGIGSTAEGGYYCQIMPLPGGEPLAYGRGVTICEAICRAALSIPVTHSTTKPSGGACDGD